MTEIQSSICNQKAGAAARNTFPNPGSDLKVTIGYFISKVIGYVNFFFLHCLFALYFKDCVSGWSNESNLEISMQMFIFQLHAASRRPNYPKSNVGILVIHLIRDF